MKLNFVPVIVKRNLYAKESAAKHKVENLIYEFLKKLYNIGYMSWKTIKCCLDDIV